MNKYNYIAVDVLNIAHRIFSTQQEKTLCKVSNKIIYKELVRDFIELMNYWQKKFLLPEGEVYLLFDNPTSRDELRKLFQPLGANASRREKFPEYKSNRHPAAKEFYNSVDLIKWFFMMGDPSISTVRINHVEADDLVKPFLEYIEKGSRVLLATNDSDWCRFIGGNVDYLPQIYEEPFTDKDFASRNGYLPTEESIVFYKVLFGDEADHIPSAFPDLKKEEKDLLFKSASSIQQLYDNISILPKSLKDYCKSRERAAQSAYQMVSIIPIQVEHFKASIVKGRKADIYTDALSKMLGLIEGADTDSFQFGFLACPRLDPKE